MNPSPIEIEPDNNYQDIIDMFLADTMHLHLLLKGYTVKSVQVESNKSLVGDEVREQTAYAAKISNAEKLYNMGIISQTETAQMLGYEKADQEEPRNAFAPFLPTDEGEEDEVAPKTTAANIKSNITEIEVRLGKLSPKFDYGDTYDVCGCSNKQYSISEFNAAQEFDNAVRAYAKSVGITPS